MAAEEDPEGAAGVDDYYRTCAIPKGTYRKPTAAEQKRIKAQIRLDQKGVCIANGISPVCTYHIDDPHEILPRGAGYPMSRWNTVGVCRACHCAAQGRVGGNLLIFDWPGKADGALPNVAAGTVRVIWRKQKQGASDVRAGHRSPGP